MRRRDLPAELHPVKTIEEVGACLGVSPQMVWKLERSAINKLTRFREMFDADLEVDRIARSERRRRERKLERIPMGVAIYRPDSEVPQLPSLNVMTMQERRAKIWQMHKEGRSTNEISAEVNLPISEVRCLIGRMRA